jgi:subtilisin family serine protease
MKQETYTRRAGAALAALAFAAVAMIAALSFNQFSTASAARVSDSVIVVLKDDAGAVYKAKSAKAGKQVSDAELQAYRDSLAAKQNDFLAALKAKGINYQLDGVDVKDFAGASAGHVDFRYTLVLNGVTIKVPGSAINVIKAMPQVKSVQTNPVMRVQLDKSVPYINAPAVYGKYPELTPFDTFNEGYEGQGVNIAVLDTGIDWTHPMFGGDPTPPRFGLAPNVSAVPTNKKVIYYMTFTGGLIDDFGHGSHSSADAAGYLGMAPGADGIPGTADDIPVHGVAPQARLMGYKVCTGTGSCLGASTIMALEDAVSPVSLSLQPKPVAHVINLSLGGAGTPDDDTAVAASNAALMGATVVAAAGNSGPGESTLGSPAAGRHVIAVAATTHPGAADANWTVDVLQASAVSQDQTGAVSPAKNFPTQPGFNRIKLYPMAGTPDPAAGSIAQHYVLVDNPTGTWPASVSGRIALVKDPGAASATFFDVSNVAAASGAVAVLNVTSTTNPTAVKGTIPSANILPADAQVLIDAMSANGEPATNGTVSPLPIRLNPFTDDVFVGSTATFSSRGPVAGLGQVKPDVTAPGVKIISATARVAGAETNGGTMFDPTGYISGDGTSFSCPHVTGAAALVKQAHLDWTPDMIRAAFINTATNMRTAAGAAQPDGAKSDSIIDQGGGLIDVRAAVNAPALMGVAGDGIVEPALLASHSFGELPVINNRITNTRSVTVTIRDVSGQGGTYNLSTANNRFFDRDGVTASVSPSSVTVQPNGTATFNATVTFDGDKQRDTSAPMELQWYVVAKRSGSGETLRAPMYLKATPTLPSDDISASDTKTYTGTVAAGDAGVQRDNDVMVAQDVTYVDVPFEVGASTLKIDATLSWSYQTVGDVPSLGTIGLPDLDFSLLDPDGKEIAQSASGNGPEHIVVNVSRPGTYTYRAYGWVAAATDFQITSTQLLGASAPTVQPIGGDFTDASGNAYDFDGGYTLSWQPQGSGAQKYEIEETTDGTNYAIIRTVDNQTTSLAFANAPEGTRGYRVRSITAGRIGYFETLPSNSVSITVARRTEIDATTLVDAVNKSISFANGETTLSTALKNKTADQSLYPTLSFQIVSIQSNGAPVSVKNGENGGDGVSNPAAFDYSRLVGNALAPGAESAAKTIRFANPNLALFSFTARITAHVPAGGQTSTTSGGTSLTTTQGAVNSGGSQTTGTGLTGTHTVPTGTQLMSFTVNPLTRTVSVKLISK